MRNFLKIAEGINTTPLLNQIIRNEDLWNQNRFRTSAEGTPFGEADDIWLRYSPPEDLKVHNGAMGSTATVWYPAREVLTEAIPLIKGLMGTVGAFALDRVIISRLAPGKKMLPHIDAGCEYTQQHNIARYHIALQGLPGCNFYCGDVPEDGPPDVEAVNMETGSVWWFNAHKCHWVVNDSADDRIHMLVDVRLF